MNARYVDLNDPRVNLSFGQRNLEMLRDSRITQGKLPKIMAAYNAGPHRVDRWRHKAGEEVPVEVWIETIPYRETRNYVQAVLAYSTVFDRSLGKNTLMSSRMGDIKTEY